MNACEPARTQDGQEPEFLRWHWLDLPLKVQGQLVAKEQILRSERGAGAEIYPHELHEIDREPDHDLGGVNSS